MDVVSTKTAATRALTEVLADHPNVLATHPLFGPPSVERICEGCRIVITHESGDRSQAFVSFMAERLELDVLRMSSEEHDRAMAYMQSLPFFIARALVHLDILKFGDREELAIPSFEKLLTIARIEQAHSREMFETSQLSNPFAANARYQFIEMLLKVDAELNGDGKRAMPEVQALEDQ